MGDEREADFQAYKASLPKAPVIWLRGCRDCDTTGHRVISAMGETPKYHILCECIKQFNCPCCGKKHGKPFFATPGEFLTRCHVCGWSYV